MKKKAAFFDRDGIVNYRPVGDYVVNFAQFIFIPDFFNFFKILKNNDFLTFIVSNQQGVSKEIMTEADLIYIHNQMQQSILFETGSAFEDIYYCTDSAETKSKRRKPNPGMLLEAIEKYNIDPKRSIMIGDTDSDMLAGKNAEIGLKALVSLFEKNDYNCDIRCKGLEELTEYLRLNEYIR